MEIEEFLENNERFKLLIIQYLEIEKSDHVHISRLYELTGLTKFKMDNLLAELSDDLLFFPEKPQIIIDSAGVMEVRNVTLEIVKRLKLYYLEHSYTFKLLEDLVEHQVSIDLFSKKHHLSNSQIYVKRKILKDFLKQKGIKLKKNLFIGDEIHIRNQLFSIYYEAYNGIKFPFSNHIYQIVVKLIHLYEHWFNLKITHTERIKLQIIIGLSLCRMKSLHYVPADLFFINQTTQALFQFPIPIFSEISEGTNDQLVGESQYLLLYIYFNIKGDYSESLTAQINNEKFQKIDEFSDELTTQIFSSLYFAQTVSTEDSTAVFREFTERIKISNRNRFFFDFKVMSFRSKRSLRFFKETYPEISYLVKETIERNIVRHEIMRNATSVQLFYDTIFILFAVCPVNWLEIPINICVDFTLGEYYNDFICKQISGFKHFNLNITTRLSQETNIYVSDCIITDANVKQIIWRSPPSADDWEYFGNCMIEVKNEMNKK